MERIRFILPAISCLEIQVIAACRSNFREGSFYQIKPHKVRFRSKFDLDVSYRNRVNDEATRWYQSINQVLLIDSISTRPQPSWIFRKKPLINTNKWVWCVVRKLNMSKSSENRSMKDKVYYLQIICQDLPSKVTKSVARVVEST